MAHSRFRNTILYQNELVQDEMKVFLSNDLGSYLTVQRLIPTHMTSGALFVFVLNHISRNNRNNSIPSSNVSLKSYSEMNTIDAIKNLMFDNKYHLENIFKEMCQLDYGYLKMLRCNVECAQISQYETKACPFNRICHCDKIQKWRGKEELEAQAVDNLQLAVHTSI